MRHKTLLLTTVAACSLLLCSMRGDMRNLTPACKCYNGGAGWSVDNQCNGTYCSAANLIVDNLSCRDASSAFPSFCSAGGSVTVTYDSCTQVACVAESNVGSNCVGTCPANPAQRAVSSGNSDGPTVPACCGLSLGGCAYLFVVTFHSTGSSCPGGTIHCTYAHAFHCEPF